MPSSERLYVALYARGGVSTMPGGEDKYHWAFIVGPKREPIGARGKRYHAKEAFAVDSHGQSTWQVEEKDIRMAPTMMILIRVMIGKIKRGDRLAAILNNVPVPDPSAGGNCVTWIQEALMALKRFQESGAGALESSSYQLDWVTIRQCALWYVTAKAADHRFDGQADLDTFDDRKVPTWDLLKGKETIS